MAEMLKKLKNFLGPRYLPNGDDTPSTYPTSFGASVLHLLMLTRPTFHFFPTL